MRELYSLPRPGGAAFEKAHHRSRRIDLRKTSLEYVYSFQVSIARHK